MIGIFLSTSDRHAPTASCPPHVSLLWELERFPPYRADVQTQEKPRPSPRRSFLNGCMYHSTVFPFRAAKTSRCVLVLAQRVVVNYRSILRPSGSCHHQVLRGVGRQLPASAVTTVFSYFGGERVFRWRCDSLPVSTTSSVHA